MIMFLALSIIASIVFWIIGYGVVATLSKNSRYLHEISIIFGFASISYFCYLVAYFKIPIWTLGTIMCLLASYTIQQILSKRKLATSTFNISKNLKFVFVFLAGAAIYAAKQIKDVFIPGFQLRTGPDLIGWSVSSNYFIKNDDLGLLNSKLLESLSTLDRNTIFSLNDFSKSVYTLPMLNDQISSEFLIGANRIGLPALVGFISRITNIQTYAILWTLVCVFAGISALITYKFFQGRNFSNLIKTAGVVSIAGSSVIIAPIAEGGIWSIFVIPLILLGLIFIQEHEGVRQIKEFPLIIFCLALMSISITTDVIIVTIPLVILYTYLIFRDKAWSLFPRLILVFVLPLSAGYGIITNSLMSRSRDASVSGWSGASLPLPADFYGLTPWQDPTGNFGDELFYSFEKICLGILLSVFIIAIINRCDYRTKVVVGVYSISTFFIISSSYIPLLLQGSGNKYVPWKLSFLISLTLPIIIHSLIKFNTNRPFKDDQVLPPKVRKFQNMKYQRQNAKLGEFERFFLITIIFLIPLQTIRLQHDWVKNGTSDAPLSYLTLLSNSKISKDFQRILESYDFVGACATWSNSLALFGELTTTGPRNLRGEMITPLSLGVSPRKGFLLDTTLASCYKFKEYFLVKSPVDMFGNLALYDVTEESRVELIELQKN